VNGIKFCIFFVFLVCIGACQKDSILPDSNESDGNEFALPKGFPEIQYPNDNAFSPARWQLGKRLFFEKALSIDSSLSCGSCHKPSLAFSDNVALSDGVQQRPGKRNAPTLANVAFHPYLTREGGVPSLEMQVLVPIQEHNEFDFNILSAAKRLQQDSNYIVMSNQAYGRNPDYYVITRALANFERTILSGNSPYDQYFYQNEISSLNPDEKAGMDLFYSSKTNCSSCHTGFNFTNYAFENNGLYDSYADIGRERLTGQPSDRALFKVPTLRNIAVTGPYMHDGSIATLREVIDHYNSGGQEHPHKNEIIKPLNLTDEEKDQLLAFLHTLTDTEFLSDERFKEN